TPIFHIWEEFEPEADIWRQRGRFNFSVSGGRIAGYRGYSEKTVTEGLWRCSVETGRGALLGRVKVSVEKGTAPDLISELR
ncbi:MAG: DUF2914 domain-containing protein, partial [Candidatus Paceibacterota bacterium]